MKIINGREENNFHLFHSSLSVNATYLKDPQNIAIYIYAITTLYITNYYQQDKIFKHKPINL